MGTWGSGVYENDHALDIFSAEVNRLSMKIETSLTSCEAVGFEDIEGPLVYIRILALLASERRLGEPTRSTAEQWKSGYLEAFQTSWEDSRQGYFEERLAVIHREFDALLAALPS